MRIISILLLVVIIMSCSSKPGIKKDNIKRKNSDYLEDCKMYYNYREYEKAIENALSTVDASDNLKEKEEALYLINESAEEIVLQMKNDLYLKPDEDIYKRIEDLKKKYGVSIEMDKAGYEYIIYYDKGFYTKLKKINPESKYINTIELRHIARISKFVSDPAYRYKQIINVTEKYWKIYNADAESQYASSILLKIADLYFYLYEQGMYVKKELHLSNRDLKKYFDDARTLYKKIKKKYPNSHAAKTIAYVIDNVKLRIEPRTKSKVLQRIKAGSLVKIIERSEKKTSISNMYAYWFKVKLISGLEGWVYGFYLRMNY